MTNERYGHMAEQRRCQGWPGQESPDKHPMEFIVPLDPKDGYIRVATYDKSSRSLVTEENQHDPVVLVRPNGDLLPLPIENKEMATPLLQYSSYMDAYVIRARKPRNADIGVTTTWPKDQPYPIYILSHDGNVRVIEFPPGIPNVFEAYPTRAGWVIGSNTTSGNSRQAGAWLIKDGKPQKLFEHLVTAMGVSPDGCKLAYAFNSYNPMLVDTVHVMNLCAKASVGAAP